MVFGKQWILCAIKFTSKIFGLRATRHGRSGLTLFADIYQGRRVLVTGHTGFKGSWLALWLKELGANVSGISLDPNSQPNHWDLLNLDVVDHRQDIRDATKVQSLVQAIQPDIVFHLAAQPLVRRSYREPLANWSTNVMGTAHVLEACRQTDGVKAILAVTTDKVYANQKRQVGYREDDPLSGHDPYSASKAACEILIGSYQKAFFHRDNGLLLASARAGNVIGGGDWSEDRLIPDLVRAIGSSRQLEIRYPDATRPWQHVLDCLSGYLLLGQKLLEGRNGFAEAWNFGPDPRANRTVGEVLKALRAYWPKLDWTVTNDPQPHETNVLCLDSAKAEARLGWHPVWNLERGLEATALWYRSQLESGTIQSRPQLARFIADARTAQMVWATV